jgi:L-asparaginase
MKRILHLSTGGTIASTRTREGILPTEEPDALIGRFPALKSLCRIESHPVMSVDSANLEPEDWPRIASAAYEGLSGFDGIVVTHGTHTLAYTACALSFMLRDLDRPVILTGSQLPIDEEGTDVERNLTDSFLTACEALAGVFVVFHGRIMRGCRVSKLRARHIDAFQSVNAPDIGEVRDGKIHYSAIDRQGPRARASSLRPEVCPDVFLLKVFPGFKERIFDCLPGMGVKGVVIEAYGVGVVPFLRPEFLSKLRWLIDSGVCTAITTQCLLDGTDLDLYAAGRQCLAMGVIDGHDMTSEALVVKLMWALGQTADMDEVRRIMATDYAGEITPKARRTSP